MERSHCRAAPTGRRMCLVFLLFLWNVALTGCNGLSSCPALGSLLSPVKNLASASGGSSDVAGGSGSGGGSGSSSDAGSGSSSSDGAPGGGGGSADTGSSVVTASSDSPDSSNAPESTTPYAIADPGITLADANRGSIGGQGAGAPLLTLPDPGLDQPIAANASAPLISLTNPTAGQPGPDGTVPGGAGLSLTRDAAGNVIPAGSDGADSSGGSGSPGNPSSPGDPGGSGNPGGPGTPDGAGDPTKVGGQGPITVDTSVQPRLDPNLYASPLPFSAKPGPDAGIGSKLVWGLGHVPGFRNVMAAVATGGSGSIDRDINDAQLAQEHLVTPLPNFGVVQDSNILRGAQPSDAGFQLLQKMGVGTVVNLRAEEPGGQEQSTVESLGLNYRSIPIADTGVPTADQVAQFQEIVSAAAAQGQLVFVHCAGGMFRTSTMVGAYQVANGILSPQDALAGAELHGLDPGWLNAGREAQFILNYPQPGAAASP